MANLPHGATARPKTSRQPARLIPQLQTPRILSEAERVHRLRRRIFGEVLCEIATKPVGAAPVLAVIECAASLTPNQIQAASTDLLVIVAMLAPKAAERLAKITGLLASDQPGEVVNTAANCLACSDLLTPWECQPIAGLPRFTRLSTKQLAILDRLHQHVRTAGRAV